VRAAGGRQERASALKTARCCVMSSWCCDIRMYCEISASVPAFACACGCFTADFGAPMRREGLRVRLEKEEEEERVEGVEGGKEEEEEEVVVVVEEEYATADFGGPIMRAGMRFRIELRWVSLSLSLSFSLSRSPLSSSLFRFCRVTDSRLTAGLSLSRRPPARNSQKSMPQCTYCTSSHAADF
jgi:hypothetical protein